MGFFDKLVGGITKPIEGIANFGGNLINKYADAHTGLINSVGNIGNNLGGAIGNIGQGAGNLLNGFGNILPMLMIFGGGILLLTLLKK